MGYFRNMWIRRNPLWPISGTPSYLIGLFLLRGQSKRATVLSHFPPRSVVRVLVSLSSLFFSFLFHAPKLPIPFCRCRLTGVRHALAAGEGLSLTNNSLEFQPIPTSGVAHVAPWSSRLPLPFFDDSGAVWPPFLVKLVPFEPVFNDLQNHTLFARRIAAVGK